MSKLKSLLIVAPLIILAACGENKEKDHQEHHDSTAVTSKDTTPVTVNDTTKFKFDFAIANIPSPASSMQEIGKWGVPYDNTVFNDPRNSAKYSKEFDRAFNLGVYNIDMCYAIVSDKGEDVLKFMKNVVTLSDALGLKSAVNEMIGKRAENNLGNKDSLFVILDDIFVKSDGYLRTNDRVFTAATIFAGGWLESLYLVCEIGVKSSDEAVKQKVYKHLWEQRFHLGNLNNLLADYKDKKEAVELVAQLKPIHDEITAVKANEMNEAKFKSISEKIIALRNKLTHK